ncbi:hypothetical protein [uncultured Tenacibaculum sp.]|uniref:hypothetical protein n=1 Tax=uncultured Tenacibaculum sp. TaxID=174713 RepID=UPI00260C265D|nr:hypothetical protein [uncultured Tenacibaculum sp.]
MNYLLELGNCNHPIKKELENLFEIKSYSLESLKETEAIIIDLDSVTKLDQTTKSEIKKFAKPIILINSTRDKDLMSSLLGFGLETEISIVNLYANSTFINPLTINNIMEISDVVEETKTVSNEKTKVIKTLGKSKKIPLKNTSQEDTPSVQELARIIEESIQEEHWFNNLSIVKKSATPPINLPAGQYKVFHVPLNRTYKFNGTSQTAENQMLVEIILAASFNPKSKYVQINTVGAGFNPTSGKKMQWDGKYDRGYFQNTIAIHFEPLNSDRVITYETSPKNINKESSYTASSSFTVGVDISKNPGFKPSYTIGSSETTSISDFEITNESSGSKADWTFQLSETKKSMWDMFKEPFMKKGQVKSVPNLAKKNLQPLCNAVWMVNEDSKAFNDKVAYNLKWEVDYYECWVTGNWTKFTMHYQHYTVSKMDNFSVNYAEVTA